MAIGLNAFLCVVLLTCFGYQAQAHKLLAINIKSEGCNDPAITGCGRATIRVDGKDYSKHGRGYNVVVVNGDTGVVESSKKFDTFGADNAPNDLKSHLQNIPHRKIVLVAIQDEGSAKMTTASYNALKRFGAVNQLRGHYRHSYALLGWSGYGKLDAVTQVQRKRHEGPSIISKVISLPL